MAMSKVSIVGAGSVGSTLALRLLQANLCDVVLLDVVAGKPQGLSLDLSQAEAIARSRIHGTNDYRDTADSDVVVIAAGVARKPNMTREQLLEINSEIVRSVVPQILSVSPSAILLVVTNPLDAITYLAWQVSQLPRERVLGMAGVLDSARFASFIAEALQVSPQDVRAMVIGSHNDLMLPLPRYSSVSGVPIQELLCAEAIAAIVQRTRLGGAEIVRLLQTSSAFFAPSQGAMVMLEAILRDQTRLLSASVCLQGEYGLRDLCLGVPILLNQSGMKRIVELHLTAEETAQLHLSAESVRPKTPSA
jgi:malate dehydrogenase (NAD) (EC 1.1.1.37)